MPLAALGPVAAGTPRFARELARAERLFAERRYAPAREAFERLAAVAAGDEAELVQLRMAESDYFLRRFSRVREDLSPFLERAARRAEARFFYLMTTQRVGNRDQYIAQTRALVDDFPDSSWAEDALNNLASFHIVADEDDQADAVFRELVSRFPSGRYTARAMWKVGWRAYRQQQHAEAAEVFERAAVTFPRIGLPAVVPLLGSEGPGAARRRRGRRRGLSAGPHRLRELVLRPAGGEGPRVERTGRAGPRARSPAAQAGGERRRADRRPHPLADLRGDVRRGARRSAVCRAGLWHVGAAGGHASLAAQQDGGLAPRHQPDAADVPAVPGSRRRVDAAGGAVGHLPAAVLVAHQPSTPRRTSWIRTWSRR